MLTAKPIQVFRLAGRNVVVCRVPDANPNRFLGKDFSFYSGGRPAGRIRIEGVSTATDPEGGAFDFCYAGDEIRPEQLVEDALITDGRYEDAVRELHVA